MGELKIQYSDKKITPWGGMKLLKDFIPNFAIEFVVVVLMLED